MTILLIFVTIHPSAKTMQANKTVAITELSSDHFVFRDDEGDLRGICVDLWKRIAADLGIDDDLKVVPVKRAIPLFKNESVEMVDIIVQRMDENQMKAYNVSQ